MADLLDLVERFVRRYDLLGHGQAVVVGVSGGPDSLCLLHLLQRMSPRLSLQIHVAHLNHGLRGADADADAGFVARLAEQNHVPYTIERADVAALAARDGLSIEEAARQIRYRFLASVARSTGADTVAVAHNADDQAETVLMHFLRGSGMAGLRGMLPRTPLAECRPADAGVRGPEVGSGKIEALFLVRPLLETPRSEIEAYCAEYDLTPRFDKSNLDRTFFRNRLRHELLPSLEQYNPEIRRVLGHTAAAMAGDYDVLSTAAEDAWSHVLRKADPQEVLLDLAAWRTLPLGLQRATLRRAIFSLRRSLRNVNWDHVERALWLARDGSTGQSATLTGRLALEIGYQFLRVASEDVESPTGPVPQVREPVVLPAHGITQLAGGWQVVTRTLARSELPVDFGRNANPWIAWLDAAKLGPAPSLRPRRPGDRFQPQGLDGHSVKLNEFLINEKVPRASRAGWPILEGQGGIAWICGLRLDERAAVGERTEAVCELRFEHEPGARD